MSLENVRCEIAYPDLMQLAATAADTSSILPTQSIISTSSEITSTSWSSSTSVSAKTAIPSPTPSGEAAPLVISGGVIAGISIGALVALGLCATGTYIVVRRHLMAKYRHSSEPPLHTEIASSMGHSTSPKVKATIVSPPPPQAELAELPGQMSGLYELDVSDGPRR